MKSQAQPHLVALSEGPSIPLDKPIILIGRHQECDIQIPSRKISRRHCCIALVNDHLVIRDLGSTNGIRINGVKVLEGNLEPDDELTIGNMRYQVKLQADSAETRNVPPDGIKAGKPPAKKGARDVPREDSRDEPIPIPEPKHRPPPKAGANGIANVPMMEIPDVVDLAPLDPPSK